MYIKSFKVIARDYRFFGGFCILWVLLVVVQDAGFLAGSNTAGKLILQMFLSLGAMQIVLLDQRPFDQNAQNKDIYKFSGFFGRSLLLWFLTLVSSLILPIVFGSTSQGNADDDVFFVVMLLGSVFATALVLSILGLSLPAKVLSTDETLADAFEQGIRVLPKHFLHQLLVAFGSVVAPIIIINETARFGTNSELTIVNGQPNIIGILTATLMAASGIVFSVMSSVILCEFYRRTRPVQAGVATGGDKMTEPKTE